MEERRATTRQEQTLILGNKPLHLDHVCPGGKTFHSRQELRSFMKANNMYHAYFMD